VQDYYDYHPRIIPKRPIAVTGFVGAKAPLVAATVAQLTGLGFTDLDRLIEHAFGASLTELVVTKGEPAMRERETELLERALACTPPGILALGEGALLVDGNRERIKRCAHLVYVELSVFQLHANLNRELSRYPNKYPHLFVNVPDSPQLIKTLLEPRLAGYRDAELVIDGARSGALRAAQDIIVRFGL
jgi:shikimate kinase